MIRERQDGTCRTAPLSKTLTENDSVKDKNNTSYKKDHKGDKIGKLNIPSFMNLPENLVNPFYQSFLKGLPTTPTFYP